MTQSAVVISAFTEDQVERLTGVTRSQLRYWDRTGFFEPALGADDRRQPYSRIYSFRDVVSLQILNALRNDAGVSLPHLREVKDRLAHLGDDVWSRTTLYVVKKRVVFFDPQVDQLREIVSGQGVLRIPLEVVRADMQQRAAKLRQRDEATVGKVAQSRRVAHNVAVVAGTRVPLRAIRAFADAGHDVDAILREYPGLTPADVKAALSQKAA